MSFCSKCLGTGRQWIVSGRVQGDERAGAAAGKGLGRLWAAAAGGEDSYDLVDALLNLRSETITIYDKARIFDEILFQI